MGEISLQRPRILFRSTDKFGVEKFINALFHIPRQSLKRFTFCVKLSDSILFLLGLSPIVNQYDIKSKSYKAFHVKKIV